MELAVIMPFLLILIIGIWELGRFIQVQQILTAAARDGARVAAQGQTINTIGEYTLIHFNQGNPNVEDSIRDYLYVAGITNLSGLKIEFVFLNGDTAKTEPFEGTKNQRYRIRISLPYDNIRWTSLSLINPQVIAGECVWQCLVDDPFTISTKLPGWNPR